jgi:hypothetical protein
MQKLFTRQLELAKSKILHPMNENLAGDDYSDVVFEATKLTAPHISATTMTSEIKSQITDHTNCPVGMTFTSGEKREYMLYSYPFASGIAHLDNVFSKHFWNKETWVSGNKLFIKVFHESPITGNETVIQELNTKAGQIFGRINEQIEKFSTSADQFNELQLKPFIALHSKAKAS